MISIKPYERQDRDNLLGLIRRSDSTDRTEDTWDLNPMTAVLAYDGDSLIGALPFEKRSLKIGEGEELRVLWVSAAHVDAEYRSKGVGARLDSFARSYFGAEYDALCAYREDERSAAYRWYARMGYHPVMPILAFRKGVAPRASAGRSFELLTSIQDLRARGADLAECHHRVTRRDGGFVTRGAQFWEKLIQAHYYVEFFADYSIALLSGRDGKIRAYALVGRTQMRDDIDRCDILELVAEDQDVDDLLSVVNEIAARVGLREIRIQLAAQEPLRLTAERHGFIYRRRSTNLMASLTEPTRILSRRLNVSGIAFPVAVETAERNLVTGGGQAAVELFMTERALHELLFRRIGLHEALASGQVVLRNGLDVVDRLCDALTPAPWRFFQADHI